MFLEGAVFLDPLFNCFQGVKGRCMVPVEAFSDSLKRMVGVLPGEVHGYLPRSNNGLPPGGDINTKTLQKILTVEIVL